MPDELEAWLDDRGRVQLDLIRDPGDGFDLERVSLGRIEDAEADVPSALLGDYAALCDDYREHLEEWCPGRDAMALAKEGMR